MKSLLLLVVVVLVAHFTGVLRPVEEKVAPQLSTYSSDWLGDVFRGAASKAARKVLEDQLGGDQAQQTAGKAACAAMDGDLPEGADSTQVKDAITAQLTKSQAADPKVVEAVQKLAPKLAALKDLKPLLKTVCA